MEPARIGRGREELIRNLGSGVGGERKLPEEKQDPFRSNRRRYPRIHTRLTIRTDGSSPVRLITNNISLGGAFGETSRFLPVGTRLSWVLAPPRRVGLKEDIRFRATVLRSATESVGGRKIHYAAIQFREEDRNGQEALRNLLQDLTGVPLPESPSK